MVQVAIIDYGVGNLRSVEKAFAATGCEAVVSGDEKVLRNAARLVLPGVGAFGACMKALSERGLDEFGAKAGLALLRGCVRRFSDELVVPHVGWNQVEQTETSSLFEGVASGSFFYFVHSYYCEPLNKSVIAGETEYGINYASVVTHDNICGVQFHPEKSQASGLRLLKNFARLN